MFWNLKLLKHCFTLLFWGSIELFGQIFVHPSVILSASFFFPNEEPDLWRSGHFLEALTALLEFLHSIKCLINK